MDTSQLRKLLDDRDAIDGKIADLVAGAKKDRKPVKCSNCGNEGHTARNCPTKENGHAQTT